MILLSAALILSPNEAGFAADSQKPTVSNDTGLKNSAIVSQIFASTIPADYQVLQAGELTPEEGTGQFLVLTSDSSNTKVVIMDLDKLSWLKTKEIESTNSAKVGKQLVSRYFPEVEPVFIDEDKQENDPSQYAPHLRVTRAQGVVEPAIVLRLLYPKSKAYILFLWQNANVQSFPQAYQQLENQAKTIIKGLREPPSMGTKASERYILWRLRHLFKRGVFTHWVEPQSIQEK